MTASPSPLLLLFGSFELPPAEAQVYLSCFLIWEGDQPRRWGREAYAPARDWLNNQIGGEEESALAGELGIKRLSWGGGGQECTGSDMLCIQTSMNLESEVHAHFYSQVVSDMWRLYEFVISKRS